MNANPKFLNATAHVDHVETLAWALVPCVLPVALR